MAYLEAEHVPLVKQLPGLHRFTTSTPLDPAQAGYDEMTQLWFTTKDDLDAAVESRAWQQVLEDTEHFIDVDTSVMVTLGDETLRYQAVPNHI